MIFQPCKWHFDINCHKFEKRWADVFQIYPNAIHLNPLQFCPSMPLLGFPVFSLSSSIVLNRYFLILVNSMTIWSVLKLPKIACPSPFKVIPLKLFYYQTFFETWHDEQSWYEHYKNAIKIWGHRACLRVSRLLKWGIFAGCALKVRITSIRN